MKDFYVHKFGDYQIIQTPNLWSSYQNYNYILGKGKKAVIFDPGELAPITKSLESNGLTLTAIYLTHHHKDHTGATEALQAQWNCPVYGFEQDQHRLPPLTHKFSAGDLLKILDLDSRILFLPGHTLGLCAFYFAEKNWLFCNDALFSLGCGRVFEGTHQQMHESLQVITQLPDETWLFCSHEYTANNLKFALSALPDDPALNKISESIFMKRQQDEPTVPTTLLFEKEHNPFLRCDDKFMRKALGMADEPSWQVFAHLRTRKDHF